MKARYRPCFSVKPRPLRAAPDFRFICRFVRSSNQEVEMNVRYWVELSQAERGELTAMLSKGKRAARKLKRAQILLAADAGCSDEEIAHGGGGRFHRVPDQAAPRGRQSGTGAERGSASWGGAEAHRQGRSLAGGNGLRNRTRRCRHKMDLPGYREPANESVDPRAVCHPRRRRTTDAESEDPTPGSAGLRRTRCSLVRIVQRPFERRLALPGQGQVQSCRRQRPDQPAAGSATHPSALC